MVDKTTFRLRLDLKNVPKGDRAAVKKEVGNYVIEKTLEDASKSLSSVTGKQWKGLKKGPYISVKKGVTGGAKANLDLFGDMLNSLKFENFRDGIDIGIWDNKQAQKSDNHNKFSGKSKRTPLPPRKFIPTPGKQYRREIDLEVKKIVKEFEVIKPKKSLLAKALIVAKEAVDNGKV